MMRVASRLLLFWMPDETSVLDLIKINAVWLTVIVSALGYFVDVYDIMLLNVFRIDSLKDLGVSQAGMINVGVDLINAQMSGLLVGGLLWGVLGDKKGRRWVLFGSILLYSIANIANGFATNVNQYLVLRFFAGLGLAGEVGAAVTLISEVMSKKNRGYGTTMLACIGLAGAAVAGFAGHFITWRTAYITGGVMGLSLLVLRTAVLDSSMFQTMTEKKCRRGDPLMLLHPKRIFRYFGCILMGSPVWFLAGVLIAFSPEFAKALGVVGDVSVGTALMCNYIGAFFGSWTSGFASEYFQNRKKVLFVCLVTKVVLFALFLNMFGIDSTTFYLVCFAMAFIGGYWAVFITVAAEQFGTNLRATASTSISNFTRATLIPMVLCFRALQPTMGVLNSATLIGGITLVLAFGSLFFLDETYGKDLDYIET